MQAGTEKISGPYNDVYMVTTPMPFPLKSSNGFIGETDQGWVIIDGGVNTKLNQQLWNTAIKEIGINWHQVTAIYLTHYHHDHLGLAGWMQQQAEVPVYLAPQDALMVEELLLISAQNYVDLFIQECTRNDWRRELLPLLATDIAGIAKLIHPLPQISSLTPQHTITVAGTPIMALATPGHSDGHQCFLVGTKMLFSGDNLLANYHLHATDWPHNRIANPLFHYLNAMATLEKLPINLVLPGHGPMFNNFSERLHLLYEHHLLRITRVWEQLKQPMSAWQLAQKVFPNAEYIHIKRLILAETLAYLQLLEYSHLVRSELAGQITYYYPIAGAIMPATVSELLATST